MIYRRPLGSNTHRRQESGETYHIPDDELRIGARCLAQVSQYLHGTRLAPIVQDVEEEENGGILDGLRPEEILRHERDGSVR